MASHSTGDGGIPPRDASARGLKRVMTLGGHYGTRNYTVKDLRDSKSRPNAGIVTFLHQGFNQRGEEVCTCTRQALMLRKPS